MSCGADGRPRLVRVVAGALVAMMAAVTLLPARAGAFNLHEPPANRHAFRLHLGDQQFNSLGYGRQSWNSLATAALARWNAVGVGVSHDHQFFSVAGPAPSANPCNHNDGANEAQWASTICGMNWGDVLAITFSRIVDGRVTQVDVLFNQLASFNAYPGPHRGTPHDFYRLALHEFGHAAGLSHPDEIGQHVDAIMNSAPVADELRADDIAGVHNVAWGTPVLNDFVRGFYLSVLGRSPSEAELASWVNFLRANPHSASVIVRAFFHSTEFLTLRQGTLGDYVALLYVTVLQRPPGTGEIDAWVPIVASRLHRLVPGFVTSTEFQTLLRTTPPATIITRLYQQVLGRNPDAGELAAWVALVNQNGDWLGISLGFLNSIEYLRGPRTFADHVQVLYRTFLGRTAAADEVAAWLGILTSHLSDIEHGFTNSPEFQARLSSLF